MNWLKFLKDRLGAPAGASMSADIAAIETLVDDLESRLGTPAAGTVAGDVESIETKVGTNVDVVGTSTLFARVRQIVDTYLADATHGLAALETLIDDIETALGNLTGDMSAVTQSEASTLAAFLKAFRAQTRAHNQARICFVVPDKANLGDDAPNTAIKAELDKISSVAVLDQTGVDDGQEDWEIYNMIVVGSNAGGYTFTDANLDDLITVKIPVMVCNRDVAMHLKMGETQTQSASDVNEYCESVHNRVMQLVFGTVGEKVLFTEATVSDRLDMSDAQLTEQVLMVSVTADGNTLAVVGWLPMSTAAGALHELDDGTEMPAGRLFAGCFVNADKLTTLGQTFLQRMARNFVQASVTPSIALKASASAVQAIKARTDNLPDDPADQSDVETAITDAHTATDADIAAVKTDTGNLVTRLGTPGAGTVAGDVEDIDATLGQLDSAAAAGPVTGADVVMAYVKQLVTNTYKLAEAADGDGVFPASVAQDSLFAKLLGKGDPALGTSFNNTTDSLEAIRDRLDAVNTALTAEIDANETLIGTNTDAAGTTTLFARLRQVVDDYLADATHGLAAIEGLVDDLESRLGTPGAGTVAGDVESIEGKVDTIDTVVDALTDKLATGIGQPQVKEFSVTSAANAGADTTVATVAGGSVIVTSLIVQADAAQTADMTNIAVKGGVDKVLTFIDAAEGGRAEFDAEDEQVAWSAAKGMRLKSGSTIVMEHEGTGATALDLTVAITFCAASTAGATMS